MSNTPAPPPKDQPVSVPRPPTSKLRLLIALALLVCWFAWLSYTAITKSREPTVSRAQAAAASVPVAAEVMTAEPERESLLRRPTPSGAEVVTVLKGQADKPAFIVKVVEQLHPNGPTKDTLIGVANLPNAAGYTGPGMYLLLLNRDGTATIDSHPAYTLVGQQRSPGADLESVGPPKIYPWGEDVRAQVKRLFPANN